MEMSNNERIEKARKAMEEIKDYTQEQIDKLVYESAKIIYKNAEPLAKMAVEETGLGSVADKIGKNTDTPTAFYDYLKDKKSVGIIKEDKEKGIIEVAHPVGVIAGITPATNPTVTPLGNFLHAVKGKNALVICPAPRAKKTSTKTVELIREALEKCGAPKDLIQIIEEPTLKLSADLMAKSDMVLATGSSSLTKAAYSSGTPAYGVGPGNPPAIIDREYDLDKALDMSVVAVNSDNGILCDGDNLLLYPNDLEKEVFEGLEKRGAVIFDQKEDIDKIRDILFDGDSLNPKFSGKDANVILEAAGYNPSKKIGVIAIKLEDVGKSDVLNHEIMGPVVVLKGYEDFKEAVMLATRNMVESGGIGHTAGLFSNNDDHIKYAAEKLPVARLLVNQPTPDAWGPATNGLSPAVSESCGTWGNNIITDNIDYIHLLNIARVSFPLAVELPDGEKLFAD